MKSFSSKLATIDKFIFVVLILLTLFGVALTNMSPADAHIYWLAMALVFAIGTIATGWKRAAEKGEKNN